jgi:hypothetical protein
LGFKRVEIVQHDMSLLIGVLCQHGIREIQEFASAPTFVVSGLNQTRGHVERGKQRGGAMTFVTM